MAAVVTMAATGEKEGHFDRVWADVIIAETVVVRNPEGEFAITMGATDDGSGSLVMHSGTGKNLVKLGNTDSGGAIEVYNKTGEGIVTIMADEYGNGVVGAYNRKGKGRTLQPGP